MRQMGHDLIATGRKWEWPLKKSFNVYTEPVVLDPDTTERRLFNKMLSASPGGDVILQSAHLKLYNYW